MADLKCFIATFNCARQPINVDYFAANLFNSTDVPPDLIVLCLQEIAPIGYSFLGGSLLVPYFHRFGEAIHHGHLQKFGKACEYVSVASRNLGMTAIMILAREEVQKDIRWLETAGVGVGLWEMGNKGAVGVRLAIDGGGEASILTFVAAHLAPMESKWERRNEDWKSICEGLVFERHGAARSRTTIAERSSEAEPLLSSRGEDSEDARNHESSLFHPISQIYFAGDLNYRTSDTPPDPGDDKDWPQPVGSSSDPQHYSHLLEKDQLTRERNKGNVLHLLSEAPISFPPTYKYSNAAQRHVLSSVMSAKRTLADGRVIDTTYIEPAKEQQSWLWAPHRMPAWCDRVLFLEASPPEIHSYTALPIQPTSDHRPVALMCTLSTKPINATIKPPFSTRGDWRERRATARRYEIVVGLAAYLMLTWEGEALLAGTIVGIVGGYFVLRALLGS